MHYTQHVVCSRDTLPGLAIRYNVSVSDIKQANRLISDSAMFARGVLQIPVPHVASGCSSSSGSDPCSSSTPCRSSTTTSPPASFHSKGVGSSSALTRLQPDYASPAAPIFSPSWEFLMTGGIYDKPPPGVASKPADEHRSATLNGSSYPSTPFLRTVGNAVNGGAPSPAASSARSSGGSSSAGSSPPLTPRSVLPSTPSGRMRMFLKVLLPPSWCKALQEDTEVELTTFLPDRELQHPKAWYENEAFDQDCIER